MTVDRPASRRSGQASSLPIRRVLQVLGQSNGHAGFRRCLHTMSCDAAMTQTCRHRPNSATAPHFAALSCAGAACRRIVARKFRSPTFVNQELHIFDWRDACGSAPFWRGQQGRAARRRNQEGSLPHPDRPSWKSVQFCFDHSEQSQVDGHKNRLPGPFCPQHFMRRHVWRHPGPALPFKVGWCRSFAGG